LTTGQTAAQVDTTARHDRRRGVALAVDLDGTLCRSDTLHEALVGLLFTRPLLALTIPGWIGKGKAGFKAAVADRHIPPPE
jgi:hypothetical protein